MKLCLNCSKKLTGNKTKYCSPTCQNEYQRNEYIKRWKNSEETGIIGKKVFELSDKVRNYLFEKYNSKCTKCGWSQTNQATGKVPLQVEHVDGNWENCAESNLTLLCPNCHSLTSTFMALNKGNGRKFRYNN